MRLRTARYFKALALLGVGLGSLPAAAATQSVLPTGTPDMPRYIVDVAGKRVRLVGPRFFTDTTKKLRFPGRNDAVRGGQVK
ncbi:hypothetical protein J2046_006090 [Rhizobium petrolearium]|uniref:hypothetical protein n=1 Tax=Neorhizobium petrolearium TaxID=515361 RepID=UPI001AE25C72|nr:hypothetical protein [Neorhizobium petrolearium]MBP1847806.1 hypothetical protein [Neorhizobium petrolearium]